MKYEFVSQNLNYNDFLQEEALCGEKILIENNKNNIEKIVNFFKTDTSVLITSGFLGTGKTQIIKNCISKLNSDAIVLWANCYEASNLDDIFLTFFEEFKRLSLNGEIKTPQAKFENFAQRINAYFYSISRPIVVILDSFGNMNSENAAPVLDFIAHISEFEKIKTIIISRNFERESLPLNTKCEKIIFKALDKNLFEQYLSDSKILLIQNVAEELYKLTKGYYFYITLAIKIMITRGIKPIDLITAHSNSFLSVREFLFREYFYLFADSKEHFIRFLTIIRFPVNTNLLKELNLYDSEKLANLEQCKIIDTENGNIYLKDYYKEVTEGEIPKNIIAKLHQSCIDLFELQLPLKPEQRNLLISRRTIRQEIQYHKIFVPKKIELNNSIEVYNSHALMVKPELLHEGQTLPSADAKVTTEEVITISSNQEKPKSLKDILFVFNEEEENSLLSGIAESITEFMENSKRQEDAENSLTLAELINAIEQARKIYDHKRVISLCKKAIIKASENTTLLVKLNALIAKSYENISDIYNAEKFYVNAKNLCVEQKDTQNSLEYSYKIAKMNYLMFKRDYAKEILLGLNKAQNKELRIKSELMLFDIYMEEDNKEKAYEACKTAMSLADLAQNSEITCELLYKCGLILELAGSTTRAIEAYEKAVQYSENPRKNKFLYQIYSGLSTLYSELDSKTKAKEYTLKMLAISEATENKEGLFGANLKLAELNEDKGIQAVCEYYEKAQGYALETKDNFNYLTVLIQWGDYLYEKGLITEALIKYLEAYKTAKSNLMKESLKPIELRIKDVKFRINSETFEKKAKEFGYAG